MRYNIYKSTTTDNQRYEIQTEHYKTLVRQHTPYKYLLTLTFSHQYNTYKTCQFTSQVIYRINRRVFGHNFNDYPDRHLDGFLFFEDHLSLKVPNPTHVHLLVRDNTRYDKFTIHQMRDILDGSTRGIQDGNNLNVFHPGGVDMSEVYDDEGCIGYCFKQIYVRNVDRMKFLGVNGVSDNG